MATVYRTLPIEAAIFRATQFPELNKRNGTGISAPFPIRSLAFDAASVERAYWVFRPTALGGTNVFTVEIDWFAESATSGSVVWGVQGYASTPNVDDVDLESRNLGVQSSTTTAHPGGTGQRHIRSTITGLDAGSAVNNDVVFIGLERIASNPSDTMTGDAVVFCVTISYSDT